MAKDARSKLQQLFADYAKKLPHKITEIEKLWQQLKKNYNSQDWETLHRYVHTLTGSAGTYGYMQLSVAARKLVNILKKYLNQPPSTNDIKEIDKLVNKLSKAFKIPKIEAQSEIFSGYEIPEKNRCIYILSKEKLFSNYIKTQLKQFDYRIKNFFTPEELEKSLKIFKPLTIIIDFCNLKSDDKNKLQNFITLYPFITIIAISDKNDLENHLEAARLGSRIFFTKPVDINLLLDKVNQIFDTVLNPFRVLIVEDSIELAEYFANILYKAGMSPEVVTDPSKINQVLIDFKPELILMDLYMPQISGLDLAAVLRQQPNYASIPIVFLSTEDDRTKQLQAMSLGGDDFITKPVIPEYLVWSVRNRAERYRELRSLMLNDSLTGIFNHTNIIIQLENELLRSQRLNSPFCFVIIDLDHFKDVNDKYGHLVGDQVLKTLSLSMRHRLRRTDIIGRYGGEEFALILPNTQYDEAFMLCNQLRKNFNEMQHSAGNDVFNVSFCAGISTVPPYKIVKEIIVTADQALYKAKNSGRNCVI